MEKSILMFTKLSVKSFLFFKSVFKKSLSTEAFSSTKNVTTTKVTSFARSSNTKSDCLEKRKKMEQQEIPSIDLYLNPEREK